MMTYWLAMVIILKKTACFTTWHSQLEICILMLVNKNGFKDLQPSHKALDCLAGLWELSSISQCELYGKRRDSLLIFLEQSSSPVAL